MLHIPRVCKLEFLDNRQNIVPCPPRDEIIKRLRLDRIGYLQHTALDQPLELRPAASQDALRLLVRDRLAVWFLAVLPGLGAA